MMQNGTEVTVQLEGMTSIDALQVICTDGLAVHLHTCLQPVLTHEIVGDCLQT